MEIQAKIKAIMETYPIQVLVEVNDTQKYFILDPAVKITRQSETVEANELKPDQIIQAKLDVEGKIIKSIELS